MRRKFFCRTLCWLLALGWISVSFSGSAAFGEEGSGPAPAPVSAKPSEVRSKKSNSKAKGRRTRDKEAEGTDAPDRFEANTVIKSRYQHNGESLEVDPD